MTRAVAVLSMRLMTASTPSSARVGLYSRPEDIALRSDQGGDDLGAAEVYGQNGFACGRFSHDERYYSPEGRGAAIGCDKALAVDVFPMADLDDPDSQSIILDRVQDAVSALTNAISLLASQLLTS